METKATSKGQIVIPADLRRRFGIKAGTRVSISVDESENTIVLKPITREFIEGLRGIDQGKGVLQALVEDRRLNNEREEQPLKRTGKKSKGKR
jgi:AbrB family looped-hinge helix DNA binding protein